MCVVCIYVSSFPFSAIRILRAKHEYEYLMGYVRMYVYAFIQVHVYI